MGEGMVERLAVALMREDEQQWREEFGEIVDADDQEFFDASKPNWEDEKTDYMRRARAALAAMRSPTSEIVEHVPSDDWQIAIDAALNDQEPSE